MLVFIHKFLPRQNRENGRVTQEIDDPVVVAGEEPDQISKEEHEGCVDDSVVQVLRRCLELDEGIHLGLRLRKGIRISVTTRFHILILEMRT